MVHTPLSAQVSTNLTKVLNNLLRTHFKPNTLLGKLFNKNNLKLSYSTNANLDQIINSHNKKVLSKTISEASVKKCNCQGGIQTCPVEGECLLIDNIYEATVIAENIDTKQYDGSATTTLKKINSNIKNDFKISSRRKATKLSGYVWELKGLKTRMFSLLSSFK